MSSIANLLKFNAAEKKSFDFGRMDVEDLKIHLKKFEGLSRDKNLMNSLSDKGAKITNQIKLIQDLIDKRSLKTNEEEKEEEKKEPQPSPDLLEIESLADKLDVVVSVEEKSDKPNDSASSSNYFEKVKNNAKPIIKKQSKSEIEERYKQIKEKIINRAKLDSTHRETKMMPIEDCVKALKEHEKIVQEFQMKMTSESLIKNQSTSYNYSFAEKETVKGGLRYRENREETDDDDVEEEEEGDDEEEHEKSNSGAEDNFFENVD